MKFQRVGITRGFFLFIILLQVMLIANSSATDTNPQRNFTPDSSHEVILDPLTWKAYSIDCVEGIVLSGSFEVSCDGDLYPGDQQKYDDWAPEYIQFYIFNETEYSKFVEKASFAPSFVREDESSLIWQFEVTTTGQWYIVYYNTAIYMMTVSGTINQSGVFDTTILVLVILSSSIITLGAISYLRKRE